jgi:phosphatidylinositol alpha-mannosyltransferase
MCLPSILEGTAGIALEAMAAGTPIVSTRLEGMAGILEHERNSLIVEPRDPHAMATAATAIESTRVLRVVGWRVIKGISFTARSSC